MRPREYKTVSTLNRIESNYCLLLPFSRLILTTALSSQSLLVLLLMKAQRHLASGHSVPSTNIHTRTHMSTRTECIYVLLSFEIIVHASVSETLIQQIKKIQQLHRHINVFFLFYTFVHIVVKNNELIQTCLMSAILLYRLYV